MYAWVVANYALGTLGGDPCHTSGIIELGGASAQVGYSYGSITLITTANKVGVIFSG